MKDGSASGNLGPSLNLSYEVDLWGRLAAARDQASWEAQASEQDLAATRLLLIGKTLEQYWQLAYLGSAITLGTQQLANLERIERLTRAKYEAGAVTRLDLVQASQQRQASRRSSPPSPSSGHRRAMLFACCWAAAAGRSLTLPTP